MHIAAAGAGRRVHVAVRIHPDESDWPGVAPHELRGGGDRSGCQAVIPAQHQRESSLFKHTERRLVQFFADACDLANIFLAGIAERFRFRNWRDEIPCVNDRHPERGKPLAQPGNPKGRRPHVDAAAVTA